MQVPGDKTEWLELFVSKANIHIMPLRLARAVAHSPSSHSKHDSSCLFRFPALAEDGVIRKCHSHRFPFVHVKPESMVRNGSFSDYQIEGIRSYDLFGVFLVARSGRHRQVMETA
ncbi:hypothetical protein CLAIMM_14051 [Cladophialophora immunda]|nr:hypothetical protein CLAIMM_14051 [Cladophialophora immunda]